MAPPHTARMQSASITIPRDDHQQFCNLFPIFLVLISGMFWCEICVMTCFNCGTEDVNFLASSQSGCCSSKPLMGAHYTWGEWRSVI